MATTAYQKDNRFRRRTLLILLIALLMSFACVFASTWLALGFWPDKLPASMLADRQANYGADPRDKFEYHEVDPLIAVAAATDLAQLNLTPDTIPEQASYRIALLPATPTATPRPGALPLPATTRTPAANTSPTAAPVNPSNTPVATATGVPHTATPLPGTSTLVAPTATALATVTPIVILPTPTVVQPTVSATPISTALPPTNTSVPNPPSTNTPVPPTNTPVPPATATATNPPATPTLTATSIPTPDTPTPTATAPTPGTFVVNSTLDGSDANTSDNLCQTATVGQCTLRAAIEQANAMAGANIIQFNIPTSDSNYNTVLPNAFVIQPVTALPNLSDSNTTIDGLTQETNQGDLRSSLPDIVIDGINASRDTTGLVIVSNNNTIRKLDIRRFNNGQNNGTGIGLVVDGGDNNTIIGSYFTLNTNNQGASGAIQIINNADNLTFTANTIIGNFSDGVHLNGNGHTVTNNISTNNGEDGYVLGGTGLNFTNNTAINNGPTSPLGCGIEVNADLSNSSIANNTSSGNGQRGGICLINGNLTNNIIGPNNIINGNNGPGVNISTSGALNNTVTQNSISGNTGLGIDLNNNGVTPNDGNTTTGQPNLLMDTPVFTSTSLGGTTLTVSGYVGAAPGDTDFANARIEIFVSDNDASGYGEGQTYLGNLTADANGNFNASLTVSGVSTGNQLTATATDSNGNTSEFGPNFTIP